MSSWGRPPADIPASEIIESWLPRAFAAAPRRPPPDSPTVRVTLSGPGGGDWDLCATEEALIVKPRESRPRHGAHSDPNIWLRQSAADFLALFREELDLPALLPPDTDLMDLLCVDEGKIDLLAQIDGRISVEIQGRRRRRWALDVAFGPSGMRAGRPRSTVRVDSRTCEELSSGTLAALQALLAGRLQVEGDRALVVKVVMLAGSVHRDRNP
ncbi:MAG TPA: SCP2 sterol-binding domain-containing protein [Polyangia bacterium]|nr:SCP2 sterol-binding domain-containing protein [Polyangia bacterium]